MILTAEWVRKDRWKQVATGNRRRRPDESQIAPLDYTSLIWAVVFGYVFFDEMPTLFTFAGAGLIILGALNASRR